MEVFIQQPPVTNQNDIETPPSEANQVHIDDAQSLAMDMEVDVPDIPPTAPNLTRTGRPRRDYRLPQRFKDFLPEPASPSEREEEIGGL